MCGWRVVSGFGHVAMVLFRCRSNGFEASLHHGDHVGGGLARRERRLAANGVLVAWFGGFPTLNLWIGRSQGP